MTLTCVCTSAIQLCENLLETWDSPLVHYTINSYEVDRRKNWPVISSGRRTVRLWREPQNLQAHTQTHHSPDTRPPCDQKGQTCIGCTSLASPEVSVRMRPRQPCWLASDIAHWIFATFEAKIWIKSGWFIIKLCKDLQNTLIVQKGLNSLVTKMSNIPV